MRTHRTNLIILLTLFFILSSCAQKDPKPMHGELLARGLASIEMPENAPSGWTQETLCHILFKEKIVIPLENAPVQLLSAHSEVLATGKNIILVMVPTAAEEAAFQTAKKTESLRMKEILREEKKLRTQLEAKNLSSCLAHSGSVNSKAYQEQLSTQRKMRIMKSIHDLLARVKKADTHHAVEGFRLQLNWEILEANDLNVVRKTLQDASLINFLLVAVTDDAGRVLDSEMNRLPESAFSEITPNLQSFHLFTNQNEDLVKRYALEKWVLREPSFHLRRELGDATASRSDVKTYVESVDSDLFKKLMANVDYQKAHSIELLAWKRPKNCRIHFKGLKVERGAFALKIGDQWAGMIHPGEEAEFRSVSCDWLKPKENEKEIRISLSRVNGSYGGVIAYPKVKIMVQNLKGKVHTAFPIERAPESTSPNREVAEEGYSRLQWEYSP